MPTIKPKACCNPRLKAMYAKRSAALKKLNSTPAGRKLAQKQAKQSHAKAVASKAAKARKAKALAVKGGPPKPIPKPKKVKAPPPCKCSGK